MTVDVVEVDQTQYTVNVEQNERTVTVEPTKYTVQVSSNVITTVLGASTEFLGSAMSGSDGDNNRTYQSGNTISSNAKVYLGSPTQGCNRLPSSSWSLSTTTNNNDTITIEVPVYDTDQVIIDQ